MTNKELSQAIRKALKEAGYTSKDVRVSVKDAGYSTAARLNIVNPLVSRTAIQELVKGYEEIDRDERTYEILSGGNTYVHVEYECGLFEELVTPYMESAEKVFGNEYWDNKVICRNEEKEIRFAYFNKDECALWESYPNRGKVTEYRPSVKLMHPYQLALAIWRFKNTGTIYA